MSEEREVLGRAIDRQGTWVRVNGEVRLEPDPDTLAMVRREVFEAQRRWAEKNLRARGR